MHKLPRHNVIRVFEGFAGYGGATFGLRRSGVRHRVVGYSEVDEDAIELYHYNFPNVRNLGDITKLDPNNNRQCPDFDLFTGGFPCQPFSTDRLFPCQLYSQSQSLYNCWHIKPTLHRYHKWA